MNLAWTNSDQKLHLSRASRVFVWILAACNAAVLLLLIGGSVRNNTFDVQTVCEVLLYLLIAVGPVLVALDHPIGRFIYLAICPFVLVYSAITVLFGLLLTAFGFLFGGSWGVIVAFAGAIVFAMNIAGVVVIYRIGQPHSRPPGRPRKCPECGNNLRKQPRHARRCLECGFALRPAVGATPPTEPTETWA